jgi:hypothetical protein
MTKATTTTAKMQQQPQDATSASLFSSSSSPACPSHDIQHNAPTTPKNTTNMSFGVMVEQLE